MSTIPSAKYCSVFGDGCQTQRPRQISQLCFQSNSLKAFESTTTTTSTHPSSNANSFVLKGCQYQFIAVEKHKILHSCR